MGLQSLKMPTECAVGPSQARWPLAMLASQLFSWTNSRRLRTSQLGAGRGCDWRGVLEPKTILPFSPPQFPQMSHGAWGWGWTLQPYHSSGSSSEGMFPLTIFNSFFPHFHFFILNVTVYLNQKCIHVSKLKPQIYSKITTLINFLCIFSSISTCK